MAGTFEITSWTSSMDKQCNETLIFKIKINQSEDITSRFQLVSQNDFINSRVAVEKFCVLTVRWNEGLEPFTFSQGVRNWLISVSPE